MYHRFNENKYPSTNIKNEVFVEHLSQIENLGIEKSTKDDEYIVLLNYDTTVAPNFISSLLR